MMEVKVYLNRNFPMSLITPEVDITKDLEYIGSVYVEHTNLAFIESMDGALQYVFDLCQLHETNLQINLTRSLSVGDVLSIKCSEEEHTKFWLIDNVGFKKL